jgi:hypothetical protein
VNLKPPASFSTGALKSSASAELADRTQRHAMVVFIMVVLSIREELRAGVVELVASRVAIGREDPEQ